MPRAQWSGHTNWPRHLLDADGQSIGVVALNAETRFVVLYKDNAGHWNETTSEYADSALNQLRLWALEDGWQVARP